MRTRIIVGIILIALLIGLVIGTAGIRRPLGGHLQHLRHGMHQVELATAFPALWLDRDIAALTATQDTNETRREAAPMPAPRAQEWFAQPFADRWREYTSPGWARVRLITHVELAALGVGLLALLARTLGKGLWFLVMLRAMRRRTRPGGSHGSAHWADGAELRALRPRPRHADLIVGRVGRHLVSIPEHAQYEHLLLVAPTGAGKTSGVILPNLLREPGTRSLVITDPKRELLRKSTPLVRRRYREENVWALDFLDPTLSKGYNPLAHVTDAATADLFAQTWVRNTGESKDAFWSNAARTLIAAAALHLVATEEVTPPLVGLVDLLCGTPAEQVSATLASSPVPEVRRLARGFLANMTKNERLLGSVFTELPPRFTCLNLGAVRAVTGTNEVDFARLATIPTALYLALDPQYNKTLAPLTACFFLHLFTTLTAIAKADPGGALPIPVMAYLDEFGTIGHIPEFASRMATVRSAGIGCLLVVQDQAQLEKAYGKEDADTILSNATTKMCLARVTRDDAEYFSALAGKTTVLSANQSASRPLLLPWADRGNRGVGEVARALITPDELRTMREEIFIVAGDHHPIRARQRRYYDDPSLARLLPGATAADPLTTLRRRTSLPVPVLDAPRAPDPTVTPTVAALAAPVAPDNMATVLPTAPGPVAPAPMAAPQFDAPPVSLAAGSLARAEDAGPPAAEGVPIRLSPSQRAVLDALAVMPTASSTDLERMCGIKRSTVRGALRELRGKLAIGQEEDIVRAARERGLLPGEAMPRAVSAEYVCSGDAEADGQ
jgi:type IV secretion system protein VirD4